ncbi:MAG TPA: thioredoxin [Streptosporangiaceae bacterium]|jgi:thioredoxin 1|nr:thioredoxin [Streptosporangiaceae bacterium]
MTTLKSVTDQTFEAEVLTSPRPVIVDCWAEWCGPCRQVGPILEAIAAEQPEVDVVALNVDENHETARRYGILHVPTVSLFSGGQVVRQVVGVRSKSALLREFADFL